MQNNRIDNINSVCYLFHKNINENNITDIDNNIIRKYSLESLIKTNNKGLISLILQYGINISNNEIINLISPYISMKRDFLNLILYFKRDKLKCINIFNEKINPESLLVKDIEFIIDNNLNFLFHYLEGLFIKMDINGNEYSDINFKQFKINEPSKYKEKFTKKINKTIYNNFEKILSNNHDYIIDAGNIIFSRNGDFGEHSIEDLKFTITNYPNSLIIIHERHLRNKDVSNLVKNHLYFATPKNLNDDIFIILAFLNKQVNIITNDNYRDHTIDDINFRNHIQGKSIRYINNKGIISFDRTKNFTYCIQIIDNKAYIPAQLGFIRISIDN